MIIWRLSVANINMFYRSIQQVYIIISLMNGVLWLLLGMFANIDYTERRQLWHEVFGQNIITLVANDFYYIDGLQEKRGERAFVFRVDSREQRSSWKQTIQWTFIGSRFIWCNNRLEGDQGCGRGLTKSFLQLVRFRCIIIIMLDTQIASNYHSTLIMSKTFIFHQSPFRFKRFWLFYFQS